MDGPSPLVALFLGLHLSPLANTHLRSELYTWHGECTRSEVARCSTCCLPMAAGAGSVEVVVPSGAVVSIRTRPSAWLYCLNSRRVAMPFGQSRDQ